MGNDAAAEDVVRTAARAGEPDRYVAALLAPRRARADLVALAAFLSEASRAVAVASEPMIGEIRLQWWRDAITAGETTGSPVADAMLRTIAEHALPRDLVQSILDGKSRELEPAATLQEIISDRIGVESAAFQLAARILGVEKYSRRRCRNCRRSRMLRPRPPSALAAPLHTAHFAVNDDSRVRSAHRLGNGRRSCYRRREGLARAMPGAHHLVPGRFAGNSPRCPRRALFAGFGGGRSQHRQRESGNLSDHTSMAAVAGARARTPVTPGTRKAEGDA